MGSVLFCFVSVKCTLHLCSVEYPLKAKNYRGFSVTQSESLNVALVLCILTSQTLKQVLNLKLLKLLKTTKFDHHYYRVEGKITLRPFSLYRSI